VIILVAQNDAPPRDIGTATSSATFFRSIGGSVGVAVFGAIFASRLAGPADPARGVSPEAVATALHTVFLAAAPVAALGALVVLTLKEVPLRHA